MCWVRRVALGYWAIASLTPAPAVAAGPEPVPAAAAPLAPAAPPTYALAWVRAEGAEDCPNGHALSVEVERRLGRAVFDVAAERSLEVEVTRFGNVYRSDVYVRDAAGHARRPSTISKRRAGLWRAGERHGACDRAGHRS